MENDKENQNEDSTSKTHKLEVKQYNNIKIWKQKQNTLSDGIMSKIEYDKRVVKEALKRIKGEENEDSEKKKIEKIKRMNTLKATKSAKNISNVSENAQIILKKINRHIKKIKESTEDITAMNALYLDNKILNYSKNLGLIQSEKNKMNNMNINNKSASDINKSLQETNKNENENGNGNKKEIEKDNYSKAIEKKDKRNNFLYVNDVYRRQLNRAFMKFNPMTYLNNLKLLIQVSPSVREDVKKTKDDVEVDINKLCDEHRYQKKLDLILKKNRSRSVEMNSRNNKKTYKSTDNLNVKSNLINPKININKSMNSNKDENNSNNIINKPAFVILPKIPREASRPKDLQIGVNILKKLKRRETKKIITVKDQKMEEAYKMYNITKEVDNLIQEKNINEKVDQFIYDYKLRNYYRNLSDNENKNIVTDKDYYSQQKSKINDMLGELYINKMQKMVKEKEKYYGDKIRRDKNDYFLKIDNELKRSLNEFDNNIVLNQVNLNPDESNNESFEETTKKSMET